MRKRLGVLWCLVILSLFCLTGCSSQAVGLMPGTTSSERVPKPTIDVIMLDVGQGDAILIKTNEENVLIDTSDQDERDKLKRELEKAGIKKLDKVILTHPHADHIGGMDLLLKDFQVGEVYDNGMPSTSKIYIRYMQELKKQGINRQGLKAGDVLELGGGAQFKVLAPSEELAAEGAQKGYKHNPNNESVVGQLVFGDFKMMLTGDAEKEEENAILAANAPESLKSQILKAGHHGSKTSSSKEWLRAVAPEAALISCGAGNDYGHPHKETMKKYEILKLAVYETDKNGAITVTTDGHGYDIRPERGDKQ